MDWNTQWHISAVLNLWEQHFTSAFVLRLRLYRHSTSAIASNAIIFWWWWWMSGGIRCAYISKHRQLHHFANFGWPHKAPVSWVCILYTHTQRERMKERWKRGRERAAFHITLVECWAFCSGLIYNRNENRKTEYHNFPMHLGEWLGQFNCSLSFNFCISF